MRCRWPHSGGEAPPPPTPSLPHHPAVAPAPPQAYDQHLNMVLGEVEETVTMVEIDEETFEEIIKVRRPPALPHLAPPPGAAARSLRAPPPKASTDSANKRKPHFEAYWLAPPSLSPN